MAEEKRIRLAVINEILPKEMFVRVLRFLDFKTISIARKTCKEWKRIIDLFNLSKDASPCLILAGGIMDPAPDVGILTNNQEELQRKTVSYVQVITGDLGNKKLPDLPEDISESAMVLHNGTILLCGGRYKNQKKCLKLDQGTWTEHSTLNMERVGHSVVSTQNTTFIFGGEDSSETTYEYLPKDSTTWITGKTKIPAPFYNGSAIVVKPDQEIWLIGAQGMDGYDSPSSIISFNVHDHTFRVLPIQMKVSRDDYKCAFIPNTNKIMVTGGIAYGYSSEYGYPDLDVSEIIDVENGSVNVAEPMNAKRADHGIGVIAINGEERLVVLGGDNEGKWLDSVEIYNSQTKKWETTEMKLKDPSVSFGVLSVKLGTIISML